MSVQGGVEEMKSGRVVVTADVESMSDIWFYQDGFIKNKVMHDSKVIMVAASCKPKPEQGLSSPLSWSDHAPCVSSVVVPNHESSGDGQRRAGSQGGFVDRDSTACPELDSPDERPHH